MEYYFSTREIAFITVISTLALIVTLIVRPKKELLDSIKSLAVIKVLAPSITYITYILLIFFLGLQNGLWADNLFGTLFMWFISIGIASFLLAREAHKKNIFKEIICKPFGIMIGFTYLGGVYTFPIGIEIFCCVLYLLMIGIFSYWHSKNIYIKAKVILGILIFSLLSINFLYSLITFVENPNNDIAIIVGKAMLPIIMTIAIIPFIYLFAVYMAYEDLFSMISYLSPEDTKFITYLALISVCKLNFRKIRKFRKSGSKATNRGKNFKEARKFLKDIEPIIEGKKI